MKTIRPDMGVCARVQPSPIHGCGAFAIVAIPKGAYPFGAEDDELQKVPVGDVQSLPLAVQKLYTDFCVFLPGGKAYLCPQSFNELGVGWYVNHSTTPNLVCDTQYRFMAVRDIAAGEELTVDYSTYCEAGL